MLREQFLLFAGPLPEPMLFLTGDGRILAANPAIEKRLGILTPSLAGKQLADCVTDPPDRVAHYLRLCSRSRDPVFGSVTLRAGASQEIVCRAEGSVVSPAANGSAAHVMMRLLPKESGTRQFLALNLRVEELNREIERRWRAEALARQQESRLRVTLRSIGDAVITTDASGRITSMNPVAEGLTGWVEHEAVGRDLAEVFNIVNETTRRQVENPALRALKEGVIVGLANHTVLIARDGTERPIDDSAAPIPGPEGKPDGSVLVFRDITDRKRHEKALREQQEWLRVTLASIGDAVIATDTASRVVFLNEMARSLTGWAGALAHGQPLEKVFPIVNEQSGRTLKNPVERVLREGRTVGLGNHTILLAQDGTRRPIDDSAAPIRDADGRILGTVLIFRDVSEQRRAEQEVRRAAERSRTILESITDAFYTLDRDWRFTYVNQQAERLLSRSREELLGRNHWSMYPETVGTEVERHYRRAATENVTVNFEVFLPAHDRWYEFHAYPSAEGLSIYFRDVSQRRRDQAALRESEEKFRLMADTIPQLAWMARGDGYIFWYNRRWFDYTGTTEEQMMGWGWQAVHDPSLLPSVMNRWQQSIANGEPLDMTFPLKGADGQFRPFLTRVRPLRDDQGRVIYWFGTNTDISELKAMEGALRESEQRFRHLADAMPQIIWTARPNGEIDYLNRRWVEFTGLPATARNEEWQAIIHPDELDESRRLWEASLRTGADFEKEVRFFDRARQSYRWHLIRTVAVTEPDGKAARWFGTGTDIHEQKRAQESARYLAEASVALASVVDYESTLQKVANLAVPYFADWSAVDLASDNGNLRRLAVAHQDEDKIKLAHRLMREYPPDPQAPGGAIAVLRTGQPQIISQITDAMLVQGAKDDRHLFLIRSLGLKSYICVPLAASGRTVGVLTFATAESGRIYTDADLALANELAHRAGIAIENTQLYQALREADRRKDEFLATLAHELRNPLAPIRNSLQILKMPRVDAETTERTRAMIERQVQHLVRLVDDLLDVSRVMRGKIHLRKERIELAAVVARAVETVQPLMEAENHQLEVRLSNESLLLDADPVRLTQIIGNLLTNAAKYTEPGGRVWLTAGRDGDEAVLTVRDNGIGIAQEMLPQIFDLFVQVDHAATRSQGGLGIGLTLVKNLCLMHQGKVEARSEGLGKGSEFEVRLPLVRQNGKQAPEIIVDSDREGPASGTRHRVMVVDDNRDAATSLADFLSLLGHEVRIAFNGSDALRIAHEYVPEIVFLDIGMPGMDGLEVARRLKQLPGFANVVLTALTGWGQEEDRRRTSAAGFSHHLVKPPDPKVLENLLAQLGQTQA